MLRCSVRALEWGTEDQSANCEKYPSSIFKLWVLRYGDGFLSDGRAATNRPTPRDRVNKALKRKNSRFACACEWVLPKIAHFES